MSKLSKKDYEALATLRSKLRRFLRLAEEGAKAAGLTPQQYQILLAIKGQPGRDWASIRELSDVMQLHHHTMVELVDRSERGGLVERNPHETDGRIVRVSLTEKGSEVLESLATENLRELKALKAMIKAAEL